MNAQYSATGWMRKTGRRIALLLSGLVAVGACAAGSWRPDTDASARVTGEESDAVVNAGFARGRADDARVVNAGSRSSADVPASTTLQTETPRSRAERLFAKQCALCHGDTGDGGGKFAYLMNPRPRDFREGNFKLSTTQNKIPSDGDLFRTITNGMPGSAMPPWGHLPKADIDALVDYVREIFVDAKRAELEAWIDEGALTREELPTALTERTRPGPALIVPPEAPFDEIRWFRGRRLYLENCASCHGVDGEPVAAEVKYDTGGYPVAPRSFVEGIFKGGAQGHQLYARIWKGMKGTPMPASEGAYSGDEMWDIIHYVQSLMRAGAQERAQLKQGTFVAPRLSGSLPEGPLDSSWEKARPLYVGLTPLWWEDNRVEGVVVRALHNGEELAIRLTWIDPTNDDRAVKQTEFRDAIAIQFSLSSDPPFYMGDRSQHGGVNIWMWKADRETDIAEGYQGVDSAYPARVVDRYPEQDHRLVNGDSFAEWPLAPITQHDPTYITAWGAGNLVANPKLKTPVECLVARGPGTLSSKPADVQVVKGQASYERGLWYVQLQRTMEFPHDHAHGDGADERVFRPGDYLPVSFAIWNGSAGDRDGKKNISIWQKLVIE